MRRQVKGNVSWVGFIPDIDVHDEPGLAPPPLYFFEFFKKDVKTENR